jgi:hypothetical protein
VYVLEPGTRWVLNYETPPDDATVCTRWAGEALEASPLSPVNVSPQALWTSSGLLWLNTTRATPLVASPPTSCAHPGTGPIVVP